MLHINQVTKKFNEHWVLQQLNLHIQDKSIVGLTGPSGSGKSTLLRCIQQLEPLDSGSIQVNGQCGFMFQDFQLFPHMNVLHNLTYAPQLHDRSTAPEDKALHLLHTLGLADKKNALPSQLSGGQKQRVALARSLMMNPDVLLCDEPTSGLDMSSTESVIELLRTVNNMGITLLIASHDLTFLKHIAQRFIVIKQGALVADFQNSAAIDPATCIQQYYKEENL